MGEVEAQLVRSDVGARLAYVGAEALAQGRLEQVGRRVVGLGGVSETVIDLGADPLARSQRAALEAHLERLVLADADDVLDDGAAVAVLAFDHALVGDLAPTGGVEGRLRQLDEVALATVRVRVHRGRARRPRRWSAGASVS